MRRCDSSGFTLIEVLVAMMVLSLAIVTIMQIFSSGLKTLPAVDDRLQAVMHARNLMEAVLLKKTFEPVSETGAFSDGYQWEYKITKIQFGEDIDIDENEIQNNNYVQIDVKVFWRNGDKEKEFMLSTLKSIVS